MVYNQINRYMLSGGYIAKKKSKVIIYTITRPRTRHEKKK